MVGTEAGTSSPRQLLAEREAKLDTGRVDTVFPVGDRVLLRTKELLDAADIAPAVGWPLYFYRLP